MAHDSFDYPRMIARALRDVARQALIETAENGLPGEHHFYLSFRTRGEGVQVPGFLRDQYPEEMTIVLQNQFWDLAVDDEMFSVSLTFNGARQRIVVPFDCLTAFADPSAQLGLRFEPPPAGEGGGDAGADAEEEGGSPFGDGGGSPFAAAASGGSAGMAPPPDGGGEGEDAGGGGEGDGTGGEVVHLDRFRRRSEEGEDAGAEGDDTDAAGDDSGDDSGDADSGDETVDGSGDEPGDGPGGGPGDGGEPDDES